MVVVWKRERGSERRYINTETGERISRRQYDALRELEGLRSHYDVVRLAHQRRAQRRYQDLINSATRREMERIDNALDRVQSQIDKGEVDQKDAADNLRELLALKKTVRKRTRQSPEVKRAVKTLKSAKPKDIKSVDTSKKDDQVQNLRDALKLLGKRDGIPDWVPVGASDRFRAGKLRKSRIPKKYINAERGFSRDKRDRIKGR